MAEEYREMSVGDRIKGAEAQLDEKFLKITREYDLSGLSMWLQAGPYEFENLSGTAEDFAGSDIFVRSLTVLKRIQDKWRTSQVGKDLGLEFLRGYRIRGTGLDYLVLDGGRDLYRIPTTPINVQPNHDQYGLLGRSKEDFQRTGTKSDLMLLHKKDSDMAVFIDSYAAKSKAGYFLREWISRPAEFKHRVLNSVFLDENTLDFTSQLNGGNIQIKCLRERYDRKKVRFLGQVASCNIFKAIAYIPLSEFTDDQIVYCPRKSR